MAKDKGITIIRKKIIKGHGGHHGGAWKVAYADFVTAMMCFFLVMWLMSSDEETKAAIANYFNNPTISWSKADPDSKQRIPMGDRSGSGDSILNGQEGLVPESLVRSPASRIMEPPKAAKELADLAGELTDGQAYAFDLTVDYVRFSVPESLLFGPGGTQLQATAPKYLDRIARLLRGHRGNVTIAGHTEDPALQLAGFHNAFEFTLARAVAVMDYLVESGGVAEERITPLGSGGRKPVSPNTDEETRLMNRRIEFTLSHSPLAKDAQ